MDVASGTALVAGWNTSFGQLFTGSATTAIFTTAAVIFGILLLIRVGKRLIAGR